MMRKLEPGEMGRASTAAVSAADRHPLSVIVENVRSAFNVGSILRSADALRADHVYLSGYTADGDHPRVHKSALGAQDTVPWSRVNSAADAIRAARSAGCTIIALEITDTPSPVSDLTLAQFPVCLIVGNEIEGVSDGSLAECDLAMELPQYGAKHSLNVAVAFGVAGYDLIRHYHTLSALQPGGPTR